MNKGIRSDISDMDNRINMIESRVSNILQEQEMIVLYVIILILIWIMLVGIKDNIILNLFVEQILV